MLCSHAATCPLFGVFRSQALLAVWKTTYCDTERHKECARYLLSCQAKPVPPNLLPNGKLLDLPRK